MKHAEAPQQRDAAWFFRGLFRSLVWRRDAGSEANAVVPEVGVHRSAEHWRELAAQQSDRRKTCVEGHLQGSK